MKKRTSALSMTLILTCVFMSAPAAHADPVDSYSKDDSLVDTFGRIPSAVHYDSTENNAIAESTYQNPRAAAQMSGGCVQNDSVHGALSNLATNLDPVMKAELSVGTTEFTKTGNGTWYQEGFPYKFNLTQASVGLGGVLKIDDKTHVHFGVQDMGLNFSVWAKATPSDADYAKCKNNTSKCWAPANWYGTGNQFNLYLTADRDIPTRLGTFVVEGGVTANANTYHENIPDWYGYPGDTRHDVQVNHSLFQGISPGFKLGLGYKLDKDTTLMLTMMRYFPPSESVPPAWGTTMYNVSLLKQF